MQALSAPFTLSRFLLDIKTIHIYYRELGCSWARIHVLVIPALWEIGGRRIENSRTSRAVVARTFNSSTWEAEAGRSL